MELIYAWVEDFRNIKQTGFSFSDRFKVSYSAEDRELKIEENDGKDGRDKYFDYFKFADPNSRVTNVSAVVGVNGCGKSNLLELIGYRMKDRQINHNDGNSYFFIYSSNNKILLEGFDPSLIKSLPKKPFYFSYWTNFNLLAYTKATPLQLNSFSLLLNKSYLNVTPLEIENNYDFIPRNYSSSLNVKHIDQISFLRNFSTSTVTNKSNWDMSYPHSNLYKNSRSAKVEIVFNTNEKSSFKNVLKMYPKNQLILDTLRMMRDGDPQKEEPKYAFLLGFLRRAIEGLLAEKSIDNKVLEKLNKIINEFNSISHLTKYTLPYINLYPLQVLTIIYKDHRAYEAIHRMYKYLFSLDNKYFENERIIASIESIDSTFYSICQLIDDSHYQNLNGRKDNLLRNILAVHIQNLSDGERNFLKLFTQLSITTNVIVSEIRCDVRPTEPPGDINSIILLLDEPDDTLHPEWKRNLVSELCKYFNSLGGFTAPNIQIIITSHSPFILSDLPSGNVIRLDKYSSENAEKYTDREYEEGQCVLVKDKNEKYLAANIHELFNDKFFMKSTIGEYARKTLDRVIKEITNEKHIYTESEYQKTLAFINQIAEPLIRQKLRSMLLEKVDRSQRLTEVRKEIDRLKKIEKELEKSEKNS